MEVKHWAALAWTAGLDLWGGRGVSGHDSFLGLWLVMNLLFNQLGEERVSVRRSFLVIGDRQGVDPSVDDFRDIGHLAAVEVEDLGDAGARVLGGESVVVAASVGALSDLEQDGQATSSELRPGITALLCGHTGSVAGSLPVGRSFIAHTVNKRLHNVCVVVPRSGTRELEHIVQNAQSPLALCRIAGSDEQVVVVEQTFPMREE